MGILQKGQAGKVAAGFLARLKEIRVGETFNFVSSNLEEKSCPRVLPDRFRWHPVGAGDSV